MLIFSAASQELGAHLLEIPYEGDEFAMYAMLPAPNQTTTRTILNRLNQDNLDKAIGGMREQIVDLAFPKFKIESELQDDLKKVSYRYRS